MNTTEEEINASPILNSEPFGLLVRKWMAKYLPAKVQLGMPALAAHIEQWEPGSNCIIAGKQATGAGPLVLTLAENFATFGGHVIWVGITDDLHRMSEQLMFKVAGLELAAAGTTVKLDAVAQCKLNYAHEQIGKMWIDFCNVDDCGDADVEQEFLASVSSFKPTLIVVDESIFDEATLNPFDVLVRQTHALHMVEELRGTNPMSSVLWHLPMPNDPAAQQRPTLDDLPDAASTIKPDVVLFTHRDAGPASKHNAELIVATNAYGSTAIVPMVFDIKHSTWHELNAATC
ncbi:MAG: hypothetical protein V4508_08355 [Pseudomonadota bacterium]